MGTRNLIIVRINNETKVAQYGQWDGYPRGQGATILKFFGELSPAQRPLFNDKVTNAAFYEEDEINQLWTAAGADESGLISIKKAKAFHKMYPALSRDLGAGILELILHSPPGIKLENSIEFAEDGLSCEWIYLIDLDRDELEVRGSLSPEGLIKKYSLGDLPTAEQMNEDCNP